MGFQVREEWGSSGELLGLAGSPGSACPASSKHQEEAGLFLRVKIPEAGLPSIPWIGQGLGGNRCLQRPRGKSDLHGAENSPPSWVFQHRAFETFST